jgi:DNA polymerase III subunit delta
MKLNANQIVTIIKDLFSKKAILVYGPDEGKVSITINGIIEASKVNKYNIYKFEYNQISLSTEKLSNLIMNYSFFENKKIIIIENASTLNKDLKAIIEKNDSANNIIIFSANELPPSSALRKYFDDSETSVSVACYKDDKIAAKNFIKSEFARNNKNITSEAIEYMEVYLQGNRLVLQQEIDKIVIYSGDNKNIDIDTVINCISNNLDFSFEQFAEEVFNGNIDKVELIYMEFIQQGINYISIIRAFNNYLTRIYQTLNYIKEGSAETQAITKLSPPVFFMHKNTFLNIIKKVNYHKILSLINKMRALEQNCKDPAYPANTLVLYNFLNIAYGKLGNN